MPLATIEEAIADIRAGKMVIVMDDEDRENEGDLTMAAQMVTPEAVNFMSKYGRGLICVPLIGRRLDELHIPMMVSENTSRFETAFTVSIEAKGRTTTGISAFDRAATIKALLDPNVKPSDFICPGHTFPLRARDGGVLVRAGQTEASVDLARLAGLYPAGIICEILADDGRMMRRAQLELFAAEHGLRLITVKDLIAYRMRHEKLVQRIAEFRMPTRFGDFTGFGYESLVDEACHVALVMGEMGDGKDVLVRVHSECLTGDVLGSKRCDCAAQRDGALNIIAHAGRGVFLYLHQEGRGIGLANKLRAYELQDRGADTAEANERLGLPVDKRDYGIGSQILHDLGVREMKIITNNPRKIVGLEGYGLKMVGRVPLIIDHDQYNSSYLTTKRDKLGHLFDAIEGANGSKGTIDVPDASGSARKGA
ncbi:MAG: bifunctional 3,4-dihydroxy-2-butanone-4-phosphate synthase/GTP cyclohydrolase II [Candidatus Eremiobacter antarcticus]|nr:bifunctional 3,4-dihydroxy-2-butanone-4-phosphate synthase/GTP cyclohydrolase II [Candidatus Eremiobacteraeota bacterium]MBC5809075.1 bifunctional 3,4-dihydroxy-2-butanone-4-phosphate synthase/GTP cyclohydrolase II [Candidatus Eremiobacteraeota bacterium]PZR64303.1 MAG: bifunctional 3,4-dihydroxy-2-butanone-4-phosphate synthase/GTP cyclohydrolase II [Candidatus Eremiobacter sp. RRmetagenome_bin22]